MRRRKNPAPERPGVSPDVAAAVDRLLHDHARKKDGAALARMLNLGPAHAAAAAELEEEAGRLWQQAIELDPRQAAPAWAEGRK